MKVSIYASFALLIFSGCAENNDQRIVKAIKTSIEDNAFRNNDEIKLLEISPPRVEILTVSQFKDYLFWQADNQSEIIKAILREKEKLMRSDLKSAKIYAAAGSPALRDVSLDEVHEELASFNELREKHSEFSAAMEKFNIQAETADTTEPAFYKAKVHIKAIIGETNILDSAEFILNKHYKILNIKDSLPSFDPSKYR